MTTAKDYRGFAAECLRWATGVETEEDRKSFIDMARECTSAAMQLEGILIPSGELQTRLLSGASVQSEQPPQLAPRHSCIASD